MYALRAVGEDEFGTWVRMIADTWGEDRTDAQIDAYDRPGIALDRTLAAFDGDQIVGGAASSARSMTVPGGQVPTAAVDWVGVTPTHRRRGILTALMRRQLDDLHAAGAEPVAELFAAEAGIYGRFGYGLAASLAQWSVDKRAVVFRPDVDFGTGTLRLVSRAQAQPVLAAIHDRARVEGMGWMQRSDALWEVYLADDEALREGATALRFVLHEEPDGTATGYAYYRLKTEESVRVAEVVATTRAAHAALWRFLTGIDLHPDLRYEASTDDPLPHLLVNARAITATVTDRRWIRLVDVPAALAARHYTTPLDVVLDVDDVFCPWNTGRYRLVADGDTVTCEPTSADADLRLSAAELGGAYLGGTTLAALAAAGRVRELRPGALAAASVAFRGVHEPF